jgi:hypothetical protein
MQMSSAEARVVVHAIRWEEEIRFRPSAVKKVPTEASAAEPC